ncbi:hypothetical protein [Streptomyces coriariae]|uniref:hypothetical protein n=1 Tax=Streptomyces coriariae TaxID=2864460 RepID=UPI001E5C7B36|nr:hypothetical protein [Streptomyces coriariae]
MNSSKYDISGGNFSGPTSVGEHNVQNIRTAIASGQGIQAHGELTPELAELLTELHREVVSNSRVDERDKEAVDSAVDAVADELAKPPHQRDQSRIGRAWDRITAIARDLAPAMEIVKTIAALAGLAVV